MNAASLLKDTRRRRALYRYYLQYEKLKPAVLRRFTKSGSIVVIALACAAMLGVDTSMAMAYQAFTLLAFLVLAAAVSSRLSRVKFDVHRTLPRYGSAGQPIRYQVSVRNLTKARQEGLVLFENLDPDFPSYENWRRTPEPGEAARNAIDRHYAFYRWKWLLAQRTLGHVKHQPVPPLPSRGDNEVVFEFTPLRRGVLRFTGMTLGCADPFGLFRSLVTVAKPQTVLILPKRYPMSNLALPGNMKYQQGGVAQAANVGESEEFVSLRDYRPGDPLRHIHWKSWARTGRPIVKEFQEEFFVRHALILDTFAEQAFSPVFEEAVSVAASFAANVDTQDTLLDLMFVGPKAFCFTAGRGLAHTEQMLEILAAVNTCQDKPFESLSTLVVQHTAAVSGCICVLLQWDEARQNLVKQIDAMGIPVLVLIVTEAGAERIDPGPVGAAVEFHQLETGKIAEQLTKLGGRS